MNKSKRNSFINYILILIIFNLLTVSNAHSAGGAIVKIITNITKYFSKAGKGVGSKIDEASKVFGKETDNVVSGSKDKIFKEGKINKGFDEMGNFASDEARIIEKVGKDTQSGHFNNLHSLSIRKILKKHGIDNVDKLSDLGDIAGIESKDKINKYINYHWTGRVYRASEYYSTPKLENRILLVCNTYESIFYFSVIMEEEIKKAFLTDNVANVKNYKSLVAQELIVLKDLDELKIMSTKPEGNKKYPSHYFVIYKDQGFDYEKHLYGTENPNIVFIRAQKGPKRPDYKCYKVSRDGLFVKKRNEN